MGSIPETAYLRGLDALVEPRPGVLGVAGGFRVSHARYRKLDADAVRFLLVTGDLQKRLVTRRVMGSTAETAERRAAEAVGVALPRARKNRGLVAVLGDEREPVVSPQAASLYSGVRRWRKAIHAAIEDARFGGRLRDLRFEVQTPAAWDTEWGDG